MSDDPNRKEDIRDRTAGPTQGSAGDDRGEGFTSDRPGNEYGAGGTGYAGDTSEGRGTSGGYGAGANWSSPGSSYGDYGARGPGFGFREAARGAGPRFLDDLARVVTDAAGAAQGVRREAETAFRAQAEQFLSRMDVVRRDEFEAMRDVAVKARTECDELRARIDALEARMNG